MVCLNRPYQFQSLKGCLPQILLSSFLSALSQVSHISLVKTILVSILIELKRSLHVVTFQHQLIDCCAIRDHFAADTMFGLYFVKSIVDITLPKNYMFDLESFVFFTVKFICATLPVKFCLVLSLCEPLCIQQIN